MDGASGPAATEERATSCAKMMSTISFVIMVAVSFFQYFSCK